MELEFEKYCSRFDLETGIRISVHLATGCNMGKVTRKRREHNIPGTDVNMLATLTSEQVSIFRGNNYPIRKRSDRI